MIPAIRTALIAGTGVAALAIGWSVTRPADLTPFAAQAQEADAALPEVAPMMMGAEDAPVTVIEYASYTCPHCATFHDEVWPALKRDYVDTGQVRFEYREVFFDRPGLWASMVARCGGEMRFFGITDLIYEAQDEWTSGQPAEIAENLRRVGRTAGLTDEELDACLSDGAKAQALVARFEETTQADGITSTPSFVIDGERYGNMPYAEFQGILDTALEEAGAEGG